MAKQPDNQDRNFDELAKRFKQTIYGGLKGDIRLAVLKRDCTAHMSADLFTSPSSSSPSPRLRILDAGGGQGQFSLQLAAAGHELVLCDISSEMLKLAQVQAEALQVHERVQLLHCAIQDLPQHLADTRFDLVICHAVIEWMQHPQALLPCLLDYLKPGGHLSLTFYNLHSLIYKNLLRSNFKKIRQQSYNGQKGSLTPINPLLPEQVLQWLAALPLTLLCHSGIRVFHDYIFDQQQRGHAPQELLAMELQFSLSEPYRSLGRYQHLLLRAQR